MRPFHVLAVCTGNTCRSPMAHYYLQHLADKDAVPMTVCSRGVRACEEATVSPNAAETLEKRGIITIGAHRAKRLQKEDVAAADLVVVMTKQHQDELMSFGEEAQRKCRLLQSFAGKSEDVSDPLGEELSVYESCFESMKPALNALAAQVAALVAKTRAAEPPLFDDWEDGAEGSKDHSDNESVDSWGLPSNLPDELRTR
eukprot:TRINITY_DN96902_c0_g1_i1.p1 TRINITY_DN96902_c0_g1~~TRINITY_DN96902_c0_g1_i1.p1  ORF type:complete len:200 (+),score=35.46 TRINITY_DN96902_c0_g1_i1:74-673(+)